MSSATAYLWKVTFRKCCWRALTTIQENNDEEAPPIPVLKRQNGYIYSNGKLYGGDEEETLLGSNEKNYYTQLEDDADCSKKK